VAPTGARIERKKRLALANCTGLLVRACGELDDLIGRGASVGLEVEDVEELGPLALRVVQLRHRLDRLVAELQAISAEWVVDH
jgi:hypothetical protein